ncbi:MAG: hypothetical protein HN341_09145 [Verrucomicrobia bacterium]|jgi:hypothetical protein|nr:hypothetical protein [Verrucomicrobiota bacterium]
MITGKNMVSRLPGKLFACVGGAVTLLVLAGPAGAAPITVANPSFEDPVLADDATSTAVADWTWARFASVVKNPLDAQYTGATGGPLPSPAGGNQSIAINNTAFSYVKQTTDAIIEAGVTYTLTVAVGDRLDATPHDSFLLRLGYGTDTYLTKIVDNQPDGSNLVDGAFKDFSVSFTAEAGQAYIGQNLAILIGAQNNHGRTALTDLDNVRLTDSKAPPAAPGTLIYVK